MLSADTARRRILAALADLAPLPTERVPLPGALGRALAEDVRAPGDLPPFHASTMDGYALRASDARRPGACLPVAFEVFAGRPGPGPLPPGTCCRIATGAPLPPGADAVEMQEEVRRTAGHATFGRPAERGRFVRIRGSDLAAGATGLAAGAELDPGAIGLAAGLGRAELVVVRRPRVAVVATGDELAAAGTVGAAGQIPESNGQALAAAVRDAGGVPVLLPAAGDSAAALAAALAAARGCDALVTTGGTSSGPRDLLRAALDAAGARLVIGQVAMRPARTFTFGRWDRTAVFGLPGTPGAALVTFEVLVRPALRALGGLPGSGRVVVTARLAEAEHKPRGLTVYSRVRLESGPAGLTAVPLRSRVPGGLASAAGHDGLAVLPAGRDRISRGAAVQVLVVRAPVT